MAAAKKWSDTQQVRPAVAHQFQNVTPSDGIDLNFVTDNLKASVDMTISFLDESGAQFDNYPLQKGNNPMAVTRIRSTGTNLNGGVLYAETARPA